VSSAVAGLIGVVVGGVITSGWSWYAVVRTELSDAVVAARLILDDLESVRQGKGDQNPDSSLWLAQRSGLARALGISQWRRVAEVYRGTHPPTLDAVQRAIDELAHFQTKRGAVLQRFFNLGRRHGDDTSYQPPRESRPRDET
jgi:hypothetical protein